MKRLHIPGKLLINLILIQIIRSVFQFSDIISTFFKLRYFQRNKVDIRIHESGYIGGRRALGYIIQNFVVWQAYISRENIGFIFHPVILHTEKIKFLKGSSLLGLGTVKRVVTQLVKQNNSFNNRRQSVIDKYKPFTQNNFISAFLNRKITRYNIYAQTFYNKLRVAGAALRNNAVGNFRYLLRGIVQFFHLLNSIFQSIINQG